MKLILIALLLMACTKEYSAEGQATRLVMPTQGVSTLKDTAIYLTGLNLNLGDSLTRLLPGAHIYDMTTKYPNLDQQTAEIGKAPAHAVVIIDAFTWDVYTQRTTESDYLLRLQGYVEGMEDNGWDVIVLLPHPVTATQTPSGYTGPEYSLLLHSLSTKISALWPGRVCQGTVAAITTKLAAL